MFDLIGWVITADLPFQFDTSFLAQNRQDEKNVGHFRKEYSDT